MVGLVVSATPAVIVAAADPPPAAPTQLEGAVGNAVVGLTWRHTADVDRAGYNVYRSTTQPVATTTPINTSLVKDPRYVDTGRTNGKTYYYVIKTVDAAGQSSPATATASVKPVAPPAASGEAIAWATRAASPITRAEANGIAHAGKMYVFGGQYTGVTQTTRSDVYDPATNTWTRLRDMPELITHAPVVEDGDKLWILGGYLGLDTKDSTDHVWIYDTKTDTYVAGPPLPAIRGAGAAALVGTKLHYFGGAIRHDTPTEQVTDEPEHWVLDLANRGAGWGPAAAVPNPRNHLAAVALNGVVYLIGGQHGANEATAPQQELDAYDTVANTWSRKADMPVPRGHITASSFAWNGKIVTLGGSVVGGTSGLASGTFWEYDPATNKWSTRTSLPAARKSPVVCLIGSQIVVNGGRTSTPSSTTWTGSVRGGAPAAAAWNLGG